MRIGIQGGGGVMGGNYGHALHRQGYELYLFDTRPLAVDDRFSFEQPGINRCETFDDVVDGVGDGLYILSTPIITAHEDIAKSAGRYPRGSTLLTFTSAKTLEAEAFEGVRPEYRGVTVILGHPLHGPNSPEGQRFAEVVMQDPAGTVGSTNEILESLGLTIHPMASAWAHDRTMGDVQGNTHLVSSAAFLAWSRLKMNPYEDPAYGDNILDTRKANFVFRLAALNHAVYAGIGAINPAVELNVIYFAAARDAIMAMRRDGNRRGLKDMLEGVRKYLGRDKIQRTHEVLTDLFGDYDPDAQTNSQLSMLIMGETMRSLGIRPETNILFQTKPYQFRWLMTLLALYGNTDRYVENLITDKQMQDDDEEFCRVTREFEAAIRDPDRFSGFYRYLALLAEGEARFRSLYQDDLDQFGKVPLIERGKQQSDGDIQALLQYERERGPIFAI